MLSRLYERELLFNLQTEEILGFEERVEDLLKRLDNKAHAKFLCERLLMWCKRNDAEDVFFEPNKPR